MHGVDPRIEYQIGPPEGDLLAAILLIGHGSRAPRANKAMHDVAERLQDTWPHRIVECAFLEINHPTIPEGIDLCVHHGAERVILIPYFLHMGNHVRKDLPGFVREGRIRHPDIDIILGPHLGFHPKLVEIVEERVGNVVKTLNHKETARS